MLTVAILINGHPIVAKNAVNLGYDGKKKAWKYKTDSGEYLWHQREDGAVALSKMLLDTIRNENVEGERI